MQEAAARAAPPKCGLHCPEPAAAEASRALTPPARPGKGPGPAHLAVGRQPGVVERSLQQPHQQILHLARAVAHPQQPLLQRAQAGHVLGQVEAQDLAVALEKLHDRQAVGKGAAGQDEARDAGEGWQGLQGMRGGGQGRRGTGQAASSPARPSRAPRAPAHLVVPQAHVLRGLLHLLQDELLPPPLLQAPLGQQALVRLARPFALLLLGPRFVLALLRFALLLLGLRTDPGARGESGSISSPLPGPLVPADSPWTSSWPLSLWGLWLPASACSWPGKDKTSSGTRWPSRTREAPTRGPEGPQSHPEPCAAPRTFRLIFFLILLIFSLSSSLSTSARAGREGGDGPAAGVPPEPGCEGLHQPPRAGGTREGVPWASSLFSSRASVLLSKSTILTLGGRPRPRFAAGGSLGLAFSALRGRPRLPVMAWMREGISSGLSFTHCRPCGTNPGHLLQHSTEIGRAHV